MATSRSNLTASTGLNVTGGTIAAGNSASTITGSLNYTSTSSSTYNGVIAGAGKTLTMNGTGATLTLGGTNTFTGATTVSRGTLAAAAAGALGGTVSVTANSGGTLLLSGAGAINRVNNSASVLLAGGSLSMAGLSSSSETLGALTLSADSIIDFGNGNGDTLHFASLALNGHDLTVNHWTGPFYYPTETTDHGDATQDRLLFDSLSLSPAELAEISFYDDAGAFRGTALDISFGGTPELVPVPEPTTVIGGMVLLGLIGYRERRRLGGITRRFARRVRA